MDLAAPVGLLTRNIKVIGEDYDKLYKESFGARILVGLYARPGQTYTGKCIFYYLSRLGSTVAQW